MSELKIINTKQYNSELDEVCKNKTDIFIKTKLTRRVTFGEYQFEPKNGFETDNAYYSQPINLDKCEVYYLHQPTLNENQEIVFEWLKGRYKGGSSLFNAIQGFRGFNGVPTIELNALMSLSNNEESQVLQAFATWVLKQEEE